MTDENPSARAAAFLVRARPTLFPGDARYGLITTKKTFRHAVDRVRARRLLRDWIRHCDRHMLADMDYVFIARRAILDTSRSDGRDAMRRALHYIKRVVRDGQTENTTD